MFEMQFQRLRGCLEAPQRSTYPVQRQHQMAQWCWAKEPGANKHDSPMADSCSQHGGHNKKKQKQNTAEVRGAPVTINPLRLLFVSGSQVWKLISVKILRRIILRPLSNYYVCKLDLGYQSESHFHVWAAAVTQKQNNSFKPYGEIKKVNSVFFFSF